jgi:glyoxylase-like metal-dependent hydrolase (beta-lactamase superfamily II)
LSPFACISVRHKRSWNEIALWWPDRRVLVCADVLGTAPYFRAGNERLAVHPLLRLRPPRRELGALQPDVILCGHGEGVLEDADAALREALSTSRRRLPGQVAGAVRAWRASRSG